MATWVYPIVSILYLLAPIIAWAITIARAYRTGRRRPTRTLLRTCTGGAVLGGVAVLLYASLDDVRISFFQTVLACYFGVATLCIVSALNWLLYQLVSRLFRLNRPVTRAQRWRHAAAGSLQVLLLTAIGIPYLGSVLLLYRPQAPSPGTPQTLIEAPFEPVEFRATDGVGIDAWWIPATKNAHTDGLGSIKRGVDTVLFCPGFGADKASQLFLVRDLVANGFNVLAIDLRAHGRSGGELTGFGGLEKRDVLGAVRWLQTHHPGQCHRILGLGESLGAVALIEAAADPGPQGQAIDAIAAYNPYDSLSELMDEAARQRTTETARWVLRTAIVPAASLQIGSNLAHLSPAQAVQSLWPRPILVLGSSTTRQVPGRGTYELFDSAFQPKYSYFRDDIDRDQILHDETAARTVRIFFDGERSIL